MNTLRIFVHRALAADDTRRAGVSSAILGKPKMKNVRCPLEGFLCNRISGYADQAGVLPAPGEFYQEKNDESVLDCFTSALT